MATTKSSDIDIIDISNSTCMGDIIVDHLSTGNDYISDTTTTIDWDTMFANIGVTGGAMGAQDTIWTSDLAGQTSFNSKINLTGSDADVVINGTSLSQTLKNIQERLNILSPNPEMEAEWDELRDLGQRYRELEKQCMEKSRMWTRLKDMPPPEIT